MRSMNWAMKTKLRRTAACMLALLFAVLPCSCARQEDTFTISAELMSLLWNVDYETFSADPITEFAQQHFESGYLQHYLQDPEGEAGVAQNKQNKLKSKLNFVLDQGSEQQILEDREYTVQSVQISVTLDSFEPEYPEENFFEQGQSYLLNYQLYFVQQGEELKLAGFGFEPEGEEYLPSSEKEPLGQEGAEAVNAIARQYLRVRYQLDYQTFSAKEAMEFYSQSLSPDFLKRDGLTLEAMEALGEEFSRYHVSIRLLSYTLMPGAQKTEYSDGETTNYYYYVDAEYTYEITADAEYFAQKDLSSSRTMSERLYFERQENGEFWMIGAQYG